MRRTIEAVAGALAIVALALALAVPALAAPPLGPPYPAPVKDQAVYDYAGVFTRDTIASAEGTIDAIEARTGAEIAVYTQTQPYKVSEEQALEDARALMRQWGVGRKGFDDGLVILFEMDPSLCHGQVQLYAGDGYRSTFLSDGERQALFDNEMLPRLKSCDLDAALLVALQRIDANATPGHAQRLEVARQANAVVGLVLAPVALLLLVGWALFNWLRYGRDPEYLDSPSIHVPAPPKGMTAATGALVLEGHTPRRAFTAALLDLASRGRLAIQEDEDAPQTSRPAGAKHGFMFLLGSGAKRLAEKDLVAGDGNEAVAHARLALEDRRPLGPAENLLQTILGGHAAGGVVDAVEIPKLATDLPQFEEALETNAVSLGWFGERPKASVNRWRLRAFLEAAAAVLAFAAGIWIPMSGLTVLGLALGCAAIVTFVVASWMPARTIAGAMARAWLAAYRRTLDKTMHMAGSIYDVVRDPELGWLETPDQVVVWATALGLGPQLADLLKRSAQSASAGGGGYYPYWYRASDGAPFGSTAASGSHGLFSSSGVPDFGGMVSALGTIGNAAPSSSSGGFGGGGGGGGGGAGGGF